MSNGLPEPSVVLSGFSPPSASLTTMSPSGRASPSTVDSSLAEMWIVAMSSATGSSAFTSTFVRLMSRPLTFFGSASEPSTSRRLRLSTRSINGWRKVSRSPGSSTSTAPRMSSSFNAWTKLSPASVELAAPPLASSLPRTLVTANTPAPMIATTATAAPMSTPLERLRFGSGVVTKGAVGGPDGGRPPVGGGGTGGVGGWNDGGWNCGRSLKSVTLLILPRGLGGAWCRSAKRQDDAIRRSVRGTVHPGGTSPLL